MQTVENVLVTGAEGALGRFVVCDLVQHGYRVFGACLSQQAASGMSEHEPSAEGFAHGDLATVAGVERVVDAAVARLGTLDAVLHIAGGFRYGTIESMSEEDFDFLVTVNWRSSFLLSRAVLPHLRASKGRLVFVSSRAVEAPGVGMGVYAGSKAALNAMVASLARECPELRINAVAPTIIDTEANRAAMPDADQALWIPRAHASSTLLHLLSESGRSVSGAVWSLG